jgi:GT2 family glycosyltransferase
VNDHLGIVIIGRNEGDRLALCLRSARAGEVPVVYVDSGSTDGSVDRARALGAVTVELDPAEGFTAARARNAGFAQLMALHPGLQYVQFVDGDCELAGGWLDKAAAALGADARLAVVCGRRRERFPERSIYNRLCDIEWDQPPGDTRACGGDAMMRTGAFHEVEGFNPSLIAGEEPDLCLRLRRRGFRIHRLAEEMTLHDAAITRFSQWWKRAERAGHAFAEGSTLHGGGSERHWVHETRSSLAWGLALPVLALGLAGPTGGGSLLLAAAYLVSIARCYRAERLRMGDRNAFLYSCFCVLAKFPQSAGALRYYARRLRGVRPVLLEYKGRHDSSSGGRQA